MPILPIANPDDNQAAAAERQQAFEDARRLSEQRGLPSFGEWRSGEERRYDAMPAWYWDGATRKANYAASIRSPIHRQDQEARNAEGHAGLFREIDGGSAFAAELSGRHPGDRVDRLAAQCDGAGRATIFTRPCNGRRRHLRG